MPKYSQTADRAIARYVTPGSPDACWPWRGCVAGHGYGVVTLNYRQHYAHRLVYEAFNGPIPDGLVIRHACDNRPCVNPAHLLVGTDRDNVADKIERQRQARGERIRQARLTAPQVAAMRAQYASGQTPASLAREFGISDSQTRRIVGGESWRHVGMSA